MTFSVVNQPNLINPIFSPTYYSFTASESNSEGFKFTNKLYKLNRFGATSSKYLGTYKLPTDDSGLSHFSPSRILQSYVGEYNFSFTASIIEPVTDDKSIVKFRNRYGYEYNPNIRFEDVQSFTKFEEKERFESDIFINIATNIRRIFPNINDLNLFEIGDKFTIADGTHNGIEYTVVSKGTDFITVDIDFLSSINTVGEYVIFKPVKYVTLYNVNGLPLLVNDIIEIEKDNPYLNGSYNNLSLITDVLSASQSVTNIIFGVTSSFPEGGVIKSLQRDVGTSSICYGIVASREYDDFDIYEQEWNFTTTKSTFLTNHPGPKIVKRDQYETVQFLLSNDINVPNSSTFIEIKTYNTSGTLLNTFTSSNMGNFSNSIIYTLPIGPLNWHNKTLPSGQVVQIPNTGSYTIRIYAVDYFDATYSMKIEDTVNCSPYKNRRLMFLNSKGGYDYFNFTHDSKKTSNINRFESNRTIKPYHEIADRLTRNFNITTNEIWTINSDFVSEQVFEYLVQILESQSVFIIDETTNKKYPIIITDSSITHKTAARDKLFNITINYKNAYNKYL